MVDESEVFPFVVGRVVVGQDERPPRARVASPPRVHPPHHQERVRPAGPQQLGAVALGAGGVVRLVGPPSFGHVVGEFVMAMAPAHYHHQLPVQCTCTESLRKQGISSTVVWTG